MIGTFSKDELPGEYPTNATGGTYATLAPRHIVPFRNIVVDLLSSDSDKVSVRRVRRDVSWILRRIHKPVFESVLL
jgi:hypothetical protein